MILRRVPQAPIKKKNWIFLRYCSSTIVHIFLLSNENRVWSLDLTWVLSLLKLFNAENLGKFWWIHQHRRPVFPGARMADWSSAGRNLHVIFLSIQTAVPSGTKQHVWNVHYGRGFDTSSHIQSISDSFCRTQCYVEHCNSKPRFRTAF